MFTPATHPLVGTTARYLPERFRILTLEQAREESEGTLLTFPGDTVDVLSAWTRDYLPDAPALLYVRSHATGECTHLSADDIR
jgi:hypothetical protein